MGIRKCIHTEKVQFENTVFIFKLHLFSLNASLYINNSEPQLTYILHHPDLDPLKSPNNHIRMNSCLCSHTEIRFGYMCSFYMWAIMMACCLLHKNKDCTLKITLKHFEDESSFHAIHSDVFISHSSLI